MTQASSSTAGSVATAVGDTWAHISSGPPFFYFKNINIYVVFKPDEKHHLELTDTGEIDLQGIRLINFFFKNGYLMFAFFTYKTHLAKTYTFKPFP